MDRRSFLQASAALTLGVSSLNASAMRGAKVVVIGGGYGGATAAKYASRSRWLSRSSLSFHARYRIW